MSVFIKKAPARPRRVWLVGWLSGTKQRSSGVSCVDLLKGFSRYAQSKQLRCQSFDVILEHGQLRRSVVLTGVAVTNGEVVKLGCVGCGCGGHDVGWLVMWE